MEANLVNQSEIQKKERERERGDEPRPDGQINTAATTTTK